MVNKILLYFESRGIQSDEILSELLESEKDFNTKFRISILYSTYPLTTVENYLGHKDLWIEIYNYL